MINPETMPLEFFVCIVSTLTILGVIFIFPNLRREGREGRGGEDN